MNRICDGRVVAITGAGRGIGRQYALEFARHGAKVVVNDIGSDSRGDGTSQGPAAEVVKEIEELGGEAVAHHGDAASWDDAEAMVALALERFGGLDVLVNNAGILRDRMLTSMEPEDFDSVVRVHLRGTFAATAHAARHWRQRSKATEPVDARVINTASSSGLFGNVGQSNYAAAKAGIAAFSIVAAEELIRYGVTVNVIYPTALSRLTEGVIKPGSGAGFDGLDAGNVAPLVVWLGSERSRQVSGRVFGVRGGRITVAEGWRAGPEVDVRRRWEVAELDGVVDDLLARAEPNVAMDGRTPRQVITTVAEHV